MSGTRKVRTLYRAVGLEEMVKILEADTARFPPRRADQPIFYPVLTREYAEQMAQEWNAPDAASGYVGFVTAFDVDAKYAARFKTHVVGAAAHRELWVPAEQLEEFNQHIVGPIKLLSAHYGTGYIGPTPEPAALKGRTTREQLPSLQSILDYNGIDFMLEVRFQRAVVRLNFAYWVRTDFTAEGLPLARKAPLLEAVRDAWTLGFPEITLLGIDELQALAQTLKP